MGWALPLGNSQASLPTIYPALCGLTGLSTQAGGSWQMSEVYCLKPVLTGRWGWELDTGPKRVRFLAWIAELRRRKVVLESRLASLQGCKAHSCLKQRDLGES